MVISVGAAPLLLEFLGFSGNDDRSHQLFDEDGDSGDDDTLFSEEMLGPNGPYASMKGLLLLPTAEEEELDGGGDNTPRTPTQE